MSIYKELRQIVEIIKPAKYLEIGVWRGVNLLRVDCPYKVGIDPSPEVDDDFPLKIYRNTSDHVFLDSEFKRDETNFDLIFIDGFHEFNQVVRDIENSLQFLAHDGLIVCHDVYPFDFIDKHKNLTNKEYPGPGAWTGDVWKAIFYIRFLMPNINYCTIDQFPGFLCLWKRDLARTDQAKSMTQNDIDNLSIEFALKNKLLMNIATIDEFTSLWHMHDVISEYSAMPSNTHRQTLRSVIYTSIFGDYDELIDPVISSKDISYVCFTDNGDMKSNIWDVRIIEPRIPDDSCRSARFVKINAHKFLPDFEYSMYLDGNMILRGIPNISDILNGKKIAIENHPSRNCIYDEANICKTLGKAIPSTIDDQSEAYEKSGFPKHGGLYATWLLFRQHNDLTLIERCEKWWDHVLHYSTRDQISFPVVFREYPIKNTSSTLRNSLVAVKSLHPCLWNQSDE